MCRVGLWKAVLELARVILVGDGGGGVDTRSTTFSAIEVFVLFALFGRPCCAPASTNIWNCVSTGTLFVAASSIMSHAVATSSSSSYEDSGMISLRLPFPCSYSWVFFLFLEVAISFNNFRIFSFVIVYFRSSVSISPLGSWVETMLSSAELVTCCFVCVSSLCAVGGLITICSRSLPSTSVSSDTNVLMYKLRS